MICQEEQVPFTGERTGRLAPPLPPPGTVARRRLFDRLEARPVVVVTGTAGYGKSSLVSSWLAQSPPVGAVAWLTLGAGDQDALRLSAELLAALRSSQSESLTAALRTLRAPPLHSDPLAFVDSIHEALYDSDVPLTLVLDDVQQLSTSPRALELVDQFLQWAPSSTRVILVGRTVPPLRLQRLRLDDRLELVGHGDLAFTLEETASVVAAAAVELTTAEVDTLHEVTQGWPAAVRMALLAVRAGAGADLSVELRRDDGLADYLTTEVLATIDPGLRQYLFGATVDELVCPSLVDAVLGTNCAVQMLERCVADGLFLVRDGIVADEPWYRWHSLFVAQMRDRRRREDPAQARHLELRAAAWWSTVDPATAVGHALDGDDPEVAGGILALTWLELALAGRTDTVVSLVRSIPTGVMTAAELHLALAFVAVQSGSVESAGLELAAARAASDRLDATARARFAIRAHVVDLFLVGDRDALDHAVTRGTDLLAQVRDGSWVLDPPTLALVELCVGMGRARLQQDVPNALSLLREAAGSARAAGLPALELAALAETCVPAIVEGELDATRCLAEQVLSSAAAKGWGEFSSVAPAHAYLGWLALWQGDGAQARRRLERSLAMLLPRDWGMRGITLSALAQACLLDGDVAAAAAAVEAAHELGTSQRMPLWWPSLLGALDATILLARGDLDGAVQRAQQPVQGPSYHLAECLRAEIMLRDDRPQECLDLVRGIPAQWRLPHVAAFADVLSAQALAALGHGDDAHDALERALAAAARFRLVTPFLVVGRPLAPLLAEHLRRGTAHPEFVAQLLTLLAATQTAAVNPWGEGLTEREYGVLRYLATNLSNSEIAAAEFISVNTVKTHIAHIYRKLGVTGRRAAVRRAGELELI
jgi:LuxR family maltose regulon positive regulatory protein